MLFFGVHTFIWGQNRRKGLHAPTFTATAVATVCLLTLNGVYIFYKEYVKLYIYVMLVTQ